MKGNQTIISGHLIDISLIVALFNINDHELAFISVSDMRANSTVVNLIATASELLFAVPWSRSVSQTIHTLILLPPGRRCQYKEIERVR